MVLDSSAILAVLFQEAEAERLMEWLDQAPMAAIGGPTLAETGIVFGSRAGFENLILLHRFLQLYRVTVIPFSEGHWSAAVEAYRRFGKGRHPAALNFGDCLSYATASIATQPLLCVGDDFSQTDLALIQWQ